LQALFAFHASPLAREWRERLAQPRPVSDEAEAASRERVSRRDCAPLGRRLAAIGLDLSIISAIVKTPVGTKVTKTATFDKGDLDGLPRWLQHLLTHSHVSFDTGVGATVFAFFIYSAILVGVSGQTLGMMIMELRVVTTRFERPTPLQAFWRYLVAFFSTIFTIATIGFFVRVHPHDRLSGTRLVRARK